MSPLAVKDAALVAMLQPILGVPAVRWNRSWDMAPRGRFMARNKSHAARVVRWVGSAVVLALTLSSANAEEVSRPTPEPPPISSMRSPEDYSYLRDARNRSGGRLSCRSRFASAEVLKEDVGQHPRLARW
jgi:hypothetical protein